MSNTKLDEFKGEIEEYLGKKTIFEHKIDEVFKKLKIRTGLNRAGIVKKDGHHAGHLLFIMVLLPILKIKTVRGFCKKHLEQWSEARKDSFYRFKTRDCRWRSLIYWITGIVFDAINAEESCIVVDDTILRKTGATIENVSYVYDHNAGRSVLGYCMVVIGLFTSGGFFPLDFGFSVSDRKHKRGCEYKGDKRSAAGRMNAEANMTKLELVELMIKNALSRGVKAEYVLFDSWFSFPAFISKIRKLGLHVICRLKDMKTKYSYNNSNYRLSELYHQVRHSFRKDRETGLYLRSVTVQVSGLGLSGIVFARGYQEPDKHKDKWVAFLSTDLSLSPSEIIKKYANRWSIEVFFKESKQLLALGKEQSTSFNSQIASASISIMTYSMLAFLNQTEKMPTKGELFEYLSDKAAEITYGQRLWTFFYYLFKTSIQNLLKHLGLNSDCSDYLNILDCSLQTFTHFLGCET
jgi:hypothetical protein